MIYHQTEVPYEQCFNYFGRGVDKNLEKAQELFKEAEEGGFPVREKLNEK